MDEDEVRRMAALEGKMWWYRALHGHLLRAQALHGGGSPGALLDAGCGTGGFLARAKQAWPTTELVGIDRSPLAVGLARERGVARIEQGRVEALPFSDQSFDCVVSADVLYHREVEPVAALAEARRVLRPGGVLLLNVPAYEWLRGPHDGPIHTARRFTRGAVGRLLEDAALEVRLLGHWNGLLLPVVVARRKLVPVGGSDVRDFPPFLDWAFGALSGLEGPLVTRGWLPFGSSVLAVGMRR